MSLYNVIHGPRPYLEELQETYVVYLKEICEMVALGTLHSILLYKIEKQKDSKHKNYEHLHMCKVT